MRLLDLSPVFLKITGDRTYRRVDSIAEADGVRFLCPKCFTANKGSVGTHSCICWQPHVPQSHPPTPGRWAFLGTGLHDLTLKAGSSSVLLTGDKICLESNGERGPGWHGFIENGMVRNA